MLSAEGQARAQTRPSLRKGVHVPSHQALSNLENASTRSGASNLWQKLPVVPTSAFIMLHKRKNRQVHHVDRATSNISAMSTVVTACAEGPGTKVPLLI